VKINHSQGVLPYPGTNSKLPQVSQLISLM